MPGKLTTLPLMLLAAFAAAASLGAQETNAPAPDEKLPIESEWDGYSPSLYNKGDQTFSITLGTIVPLFYMRGTGELAENKTNIGGAGSLSYSYFLSHHFALGGEFGGMFAGTLGGNTLFVMPFGLKATWQFVASPFEFPLSVMVGGASYGYLDTNYFGIIVKPSAGAYWRYNADWSFGINAAYWWLPQWTADNYTTIYGNMLELTLTARYHF